MSDNLFSDIAAGGGFFFFLFCSASKEDNCFETIFYSWGFVIIVNDVIKYLEGEIGHYLHLKGHVFKNTIIIYNNSMPF